MEKGLLIIISGPSGVGKGTVREYLIKEKILNLVYSVSCTTRKPREGEVEARDYFFVSVEEFKKRIEENRFLEYANFCGNYYGTPKEFVESLRNLAKNVIVEIDTSGALQVIHKLKSDKKAISIFIVAPSFEDLEKRIRGRKTESEEGIQKRLAKAKEELKLQSLYNYVVVNDEPEKCAARIKDIILANLKSR